MVNMSTQTIDLTGSDDEHFTIYLHVGKLLFVCPLKFAASLMWSFTTDQRSGRALVRPKNICLAEKAEEWRRWRLGT